MMTFQQYGSAYENGGYVQTLRALKRSGVRADQAEDFAQTAWLKAWQHLSGLRDEASLNAWINVIAINLERSTVRRERRTEELRPELQSASASADSLLAIDVKRALGELRPKQRRLLELIYCEGFSCRDVARQYGMSLDAVYSALLRSRRAFRTQLRMRR
jgi:RNA polymerase sigma-70 factor (ECF subfamily)